MYECKLYTYISATKPFWFSIWFREFGHELNLFVFPFFRLQILQWDYKFVLCLWHKEKKNVKYLPNQNKNSVNSFWTQKKNAYFLYAFQIAPVWITFVFSPFRIFALSQQCTEIGTTRFRNIQLRFIGKGAMRVCDDNFIFAFITRLNVANTKCNGIGFSISMEFVANSFEQRCYTFVIEFECWCRLAFNLHANISDFAWLGNKKWYFSFI